MAPRDGRLPVFFLFYSICERDNIEKGRGRAIQVQGCLKNKERKKSVSEPSADARRMLCCCAYVTTAIPFSTGFFYIAALRMEKKKEWGLIRIVVD